MKKLKIIVVLVLALICFTGCNKEDAINTNSKVVTAKKQMLNNLDNYSYDVKIITKTGIMDVTSNMNCKADQANKITYCVTSTMGIETKEYFDYGNQVDYRQVTTSGSSKGKWVKTKIKGDTTNSWLNLSDYIFDLNEETKNDGTYFTGTIDSKKLAAAMAQSDSSIDLGKIVSDDIKIKVFVNSENYIETMDYSIEIAGITEVVEINFKDYNTSGTIEIPSEVK